MNQSGARHAPLPEQPTALERAEALRLLGKLERAAGMYELAAKGPTAPPEARVVLCQIWLELGEYHRCLAEAQVLANDDPNSASSACGWALAIALTGDIDTGIAALGALLDRWPQYQYGHALRGHLCRLAGRLEDARDAYSIALGLLRPPLAEDAGLRLGRADVLRRLGATRAAVADYRRAITLAPEHPMVRVIQSDLVEAETAARAGLASRAVGILVAAFGGLAATRRG